MRRSTQRALTPFVCLSLGVCAWARPASAEEIPRLAWDKPIRCMNNPKGESVRVQCETLAGGQMRCLVAPNKSESGTELERTQECQTAGNVGEYERLVAAGAKMVPAIAEAPPGYARSDLGRAFQVKFDLLNRVYVGASWTPTFQKGDPRLGTEPATYPFGFGRGRAEMGLEISYLSTHGRSRHDFHILEGSATFKDLELNGVLFSYDYQHLHHRPAFWLSTFVGPARVHPISPPLGWGFRVLRITDRPPAFRNTLDVEFAEAHAAWNPWQSSDLYSHLRIEAGADVGEYWENRNDIGHGLGTGAAYVGLTSAIRSRFSLGDGGLHNVFLDVTYNRPVLTGGDHAGKPINRVNGSVAYEGVLFAINDQPFSIRLAARAGARDDPAADARSVEFGLDAGLRFSFWAPPRVFEPMPELEDP